MTAPVSVKSASGASSVVYVEYSCHQCHTDCHSIPIPARAEHEEICEWINLVRALVQHHHTVCKPDCPSREVDLKIPLAHEGAFIGQAETRQ